MASTQKLRVISDTPHISIASLSPEVAQRQAEQYARLFALFAEASLAPSRVTFWGLHDGRSWLNSWPGKRTNHPLLFDRACRPKAAYHAVLDAVRSGVVS